MSGGDFHALLARLRKAAEGDGKAEVRKRDLRHILDRQNRLAGEIANLRRQIAAKEPPSVLRVGSVFSLRRAEGGE